MEFIIDTAQLDAIKKCAEFYPIDGVTTNPTIISREHTDFKKLICEIRSIIGPDKMLHIQTTSDHAADIVEEAKALQETVGGDFYIKIPISPGNGTQEDRHKGHDDRDLHPAAGTHRGKSRR